MNEEEYFEKRLDDQINWYDKKSMFNQRLFKCLRVIEIVAAALIPFLTGFLDSNIVTFKTIIGILGLIIVLITGIMTLYKFQENWIEYRTVCESLKHEKFLYLAASGPYEVEKAFPLLVQRVENLISKENTKWLEYIKSSKEGKNNK